MSDENENPLSNWESGAYHAKPRTTRDWVPYHPDEYVVEDIKSPLLRAGLALAWVTLAIIAIGGLMWIANWGWM